MYIYLPYYLYCSLYILHIWNLSCARLRARWRTPYTSNSILLLHGFCSFTFQCLSLRQETCLFLCEIHYLAKLLRTWAWAASISGNISFTRKINLSPQILDKLLSSLVKLVTKTCPVFWERHSRECLIISHIYQERQYRVYKGATGHNNDP